MNVKSSGALKPADVVKLGLDALIAKLERLNYQLQNIKDKMVVDSREFQSHDARGITPQVFGKDRVCSMILNSPA